MASRTRPSRSRAGFARSRARPSAKIMGALLDRRSDRRGPRALVEAVAREEAEREPLEAEGHAPGDRGRSLPAPDREGPREEVVVGVDRRDRERLAAAERDPQLELAIVRELRVPLL